MNLLTVFHQLQMPKLIQKKSKMLGVGFEPTKASPPDLKSGPFDHSGTPAALRNRTSFSTSRILSANLRHYEHNTANGLMLYCYRNLLTGSRYVAEFYTIKGISTVPNNGLFYFLFYSNSRFSI